MKTQLLKTSLILLGLVFGLTTTSCSDEDDGGGSGGNAAAGTIKANVDGFNFESEPMATSLTITDDGAGTTMLITATDFEGRNLTLQITTGYSGEGNYDIGGDNTVFVTATWVEVDVNDPFGPQDSYISPYDDDGDPIKGFIDINSDTGDNIKGTFEFTAADNMGGNDIVNVTNGSFNLDY